MNCIKCYQEIPDGSKFCPYCGAEQTAVPEAGTVNTQAEPEAQSEVNGQPETTVQPETNVQPEAGVHPETGAQDHVNGQPEANAQSQDTQNYNEGYQGTAGYGNGFQNDAYQNNYQNGSQNNYQNGSQYVYQNGNYQTPYQQDQGQPVNWVPYLVLSIISTLCCCIPGIVAIVFSAKINSAVTAGNMEEANRAAKTAKIWIIVAFVAGILASILAFIIGGMIGEGAYYYYYYY